MICAEPCWTRSTTTWKIAACALARARLWTRRFSMHPRRPRTRPAPATRRCIRTRKGEQWFFGMKAHIGVDSKQGIVHSVCSTAASVADKHMLAGLLHGHERKVWGDGAY